MKKHIFSLFLLLVYCATATAATISLAPDQGWIPTKDNICDVTVTLTDAAGNSHVTFQLISTEWSGYCMNKGDENNKNPDLKFVEANQSSIGEGPIVNGKESTVTIDWDVAGGTADGPTITAKWASNTAPISFTLKVNCYDFGAIGKINAGLYNGGDTNGARYVTAKTMIPYTTGQSYIAEAQKSEEGWIGWNGNDGDDLESGPIGNTNDGDGLTAFEEYRGFEINGGHKRTSPLEKDVFIHLHKNLSGTGIGWAINLPQDTNNTFKLHHALKADEMINIHTRTINSRACKPFFRMNQKAIYVNHSAARTNR